jgi:hypothetical protein
MVKWSTLKLVAIKSHTYGTRQLTAGEEYEAPTDEAVAHVALRKADFAKPTKARPAVVAPVEEQAEAKSELVHEPQAEPQAEPEHSSNMLARLRAEALDLGIDVDGRWGVARLQHEIAQAKH